MQLGFVSAIFPEMPLEDVLAFASDEGFACVELMCWPPGKAERRYAGVTHIDVTNLTDDAAGRVSDLLKRYGISISALGYYPNALDGDAEHRRIAAEHLRRVITAAPRLGVGTVTTFPGRDHTRSLEDNWPLFKQVWPEIIRHAEAHQVRVAFENCPMLFTGDEWPGGKNLAISPATWRTIFEIIPGPNLGLNFDPSHLLWLHIDCVRSVREFGPRIFHVHAKDTKLDPDALYTHGVTGLGWYAHKLPGLGDVAWGPFISALTDAGYNGPVCVEVEDRAFEGSLEDRKRSLRQSKRFLEQWI